MIRIVARLTGTVFLLAATVALPVRTSAATPARGGGVAPAPVRGDSELASPEALSHYLTGRLLEERGLDTDALEEYRQALTLDSGRASIEVRVSEILARLGDARGSLDHARAALGAEPGDARAQWLEGTALFNLGENADALAALRAAVAADSEQVEYWRTLAHVAEQQDDIDLVASCWQHVVDLDEDDGEAWFQLAASEGRLGRFSDADSMLAEATALNPVRPGTLFLKGWIQENLGHPESAIRFYRHHLELHPDDQVTRQRLVNLLTAAGRYSEAYMEAEIVERAAPDDPEALSVDADLALRLGHTARGDELLARLLQADPDDPARVARVATVLGRRGRGREGMARSSAWAARHPGDFRGPILESEALAESGDVDGAIALGRRAVEMVPDSLGPRLALAGLLQRFKRYAAAESLWAGVARQNPSDVRAGLALAFCREQSGNLDGAIRAVRDVLSTSPDDAAAMNTLGYILADHGRDLTDAEDLIRRALAQDPDNGAYVDSMGWVYYRLGRLGDARRELERAVDLTHGDPVVREHLGDVYKDLRLFELAREQYRLSLGRDQGNARVKAKLARLR